MDDTPALAEPSGTIETPSTEDTRGQVIPLSKPVKIILALGSVGLAAAHLIFPALPIDATFLGLLLVAVVLVFLDIESIDALGIHARATRKQIERADAVVKATAIATGPVALPTLPIAATAEETIMLTEEAKAELQPVLLTPPVDSAERLLWATEQVRVELIVIAGNSGFLESSKGRRSWDEYSLPLVANVLRARRVLPLPLIDATAIVVRVRNEFVHGRFKSPDLVEHSATLAMDVLEKLREIKRNYIRVREGDVELYSDQLMTTVLQEARGVMLVELDDQGTVKRTQVVPRGEAYTRGFFVSWAWDGAR